MANSPKVSRDFVPGIQNHCFTREDGVRVNPNFKDGVVPNLIGKCSTCVHDLIKEATIRGANRNFLGSHPTPTSPYQWQTYAECYQRLKDFGSGILSFDSLTSSPWRRVGVYGKNCPDWLISQYACSSFRLTTVPLYDTLGDAALLYICSQAELSLIVCDTAARALKLLQLADIIPYLKHLVIMQQGDDLTEIKAKAGGCIQVLHFEDVVKIGAANPKETMPSDPDDIVLLCYTSGTTGLPKGVMIPNKMFLASLNNNLANSGYGIFTENDVYLSYLPLAHIFEQMFIALAIFARGQIGFYSGDPRCLKEDAMVLRPTIFTAVPRVLLRIYEDVQRRVGDSPLKRWVYNQAMAAKLKEVDRGNYSQKTFWDFVFFNKIRAALGGRIRSITCGGAPLPPYILRFCRAAFSCWIFEGYGSTETCASLSISIASDLEGSHVGAPVPGLQVKLVDIPSMEIVANLHNKGEICVKGASCCPGYYKDAEQTANLIDSEGWLHTGDVAIWTEKNSIKIVDRCKHIFKLSQGEYVAPEKIELAYMGSDLVDQVFVDGDTEEAYPVAIVVPDMEGLVKALNVKAGMTNGNGRAIFSSNNVNTVNAAGEHSEKLFTVAGKKMSLEEVCMYPPAVEAVLADLIEKGQVRGLKGFEQVRAVRLSPIAFTIQNGMLTPTMKSARQVIRREFSSAIKELYNKSA